ncbi:MAG TPA: hypothetical protein VK504_14135 [Vicinamibacterales bacterium]|nr:hypothetical protein [Vicinamibacterales bacterium]
MLSRNLLSALVIGSFSVLTAALHGSQTPSSLTQEETAYWLAVGQRCQAPLIRLPGRGAFDIYIESPAARAAIVAATATMMHQSLDAPGVKTALQDGYRVWVAFTPSSPTNMAVRRITIRPRGGKVVQPVEVRRERLVVGTAPSHGIIETLRFRFQEFVFPTLPSGELEVVLDTNAGMQRYRVTAQARSLLIRVCNG